MKLRDISLQKRILFANFMMVFVPVVVLICIGAILIGGLRLAGTARQNDLAALWPEKGPSLSIQYAITSLRNKADKKSSHVKEMGEDLHILEKQGIQTAVIEKGQPRYVTPGTTVPALQQLIAAKCPSSSSSLYWDNDGIAFRYTSPKSGTTILAAGHLPFLAQGSAHDGPAKEIIQFLLLFIVGTAILTVICMGLYVSRLLSRQILEPLGTLRKASAEIRRGNLDKSVPIPSQDELGDTCRDFDIMRLELKHSRDEREAYEQNRKELIAGISHDIATPLTLVKGYSSGLLEKIATTPEKQHRYLEHIYHAACTMEQLVDSLFLFSKLELGHVPFTMEPVSIYRYFEDFTAERKDSLQQQGLLLTLTGEKTDAVVSLDRMQFRRVVENIIGNSLKYKENSTAHMDIHIQPWTDSISISFADHGKGVSDDQLHKIFYSFYRTDAARTDTAKGSGLGLAISKQIILGLGGQIDASQTSGGGLTISITLPIAKEVSHETDSNH